MGLRISLILVLGIAAAAASSFLQEASAQPRPTVLREDMRAGRPGVQYIRIVTEEQKQFYWKDTVSRGDFLEINAPAGYTQLIEEAARRASTQSSHDMHCSVPGYQWQSELVESSRRVNSIFVAPNGNRIMLTKWAYVADGARVVVVSDFINGRVQTYPSILSLLVETGKPESALWKLTWVAPANQYEMYVESAVQGGGAPAVPARAVMDLANSIRC